MKEEPQQNHSYHPVVIVGAGVVGATTAILLAQNMPELAITVIDAGTPKDDISHLDAVHDSRVLALNPATIQLLQQAKVWDDVKRRADYTAMQVWFENGAGELKFGDNQENNPTANRTGNILGSMVEPQILLKALHKKLLALSNVNVYFNTKIAVCDNIAGSFDAKNLLQQQKINNPHASAPIWKLMIRSNDTENHKNIFTPLVIACDGRNSMMRQSANISVDHLDYKKIAITCAVKTQKQHGAVARQVFLRSGPLALLPLADVSEEKITSHETPEDIVAPLFAKNAGLNDSQAGFWSSVVWTLPDYDALKLLQQPHSVLAQEIAKHSHYVLGDVIDIQSVASFPLTALQAKTYVAQGMVLVGDSAHGVHPLAGQGLNLGMLDVAVITDEILSTWQRSGKQVIADDKTLQRYQRRRRIHNVSMMHAFSVIGWLFESHHYPVNHVVEWLRSEAVSASNKLPVLNNMFNQFLNKQASGKAALNKTRW